MEKYKKISDQAVEEACDNYKCINHEDDGPSEFDKFLQALANGMTLSEKVRLISRIEYSMVSDQRVVFGAEERYVPKSNSHNHQ